MSTRSQPRYSLQPRRPGTVKSLLSNIMDSFSIESLSGDEIRIIVQELVGQTTEEDDLETARSQLVHLIRSHNSPELATIAMILTTTPSRSPWLNKIDHHGSPNLSYLEKGLSMGGHVEESPDASNSTVIDAFATFFKLLCLSFDTHYASGWVYQDWSIFAGPLTYELFHLIESDWGKYEVQLSKLKMQYWDKVLEVAGIETDSPYTQDLKIVDLFQGILEELSDLMGFKCVEEFICLTCQESMQLGETLTEPARTVNTPTPISQIFRDWFGSSRACAQIDCQVDPTLYQHRTNIRRLILTSALPELLFVLLPAGRVEGFKSTPQRCTFNYQSSKHGPEVVTYGWLGTLCQKSGQHCRVYWRHEDQNTILQYDSCLGSKVQQVDMRLADPDDSIPKEWSMHGGLLVFQRLYRDGPPRSEMVARAASK